MITFQRKRVSSGCWFALSNTCKPCVTTGVEGEPAALQSILDLFCFAVLNEVHHNLRVQHCAVKLHIKYIIAMSKNLNKFKYFAYGSNLLRERIHINNPSAKKVNIGRVDVSWTFISFII